MNRPPPRSPGTFPPGVGPALPGSHRRNLRPGRHPIRIGPGTNNERSIADPGSGPLTLTPARKQRHDCLRILQRRQRPGRPLLTPLRSHPGRRPAAARYRRRFRPGKQHHPDGTAAIAALRQLRRPPFLLVLPPLAAVTGAYRRRRLSGLAGPHPVRADLRLVPHLRPCRG